MVGWFERSFFPVAMTPEAQFHLTVKEDVCLNLLPIARGPRCYYDKPNNFPLKAIKLCNKIIILININFKSFRSLLYLVIAKIIREMIIYVIAKMSEVKVVNAK